MTPALTTSCMCEAREFIAKFTFLVLPCSPGYDDSACRACPSFTNTTGPGAVMVQDCLCRPGYGSMPSTSATSPPNPNAPCQICVAPLFSAGAQSTLEPWPPCVVCQGNSFFDNQPLQAGDITGRCLQPTDSMPSATCSVCT
jgi:hypothetical protein